MAGNDPEITTNGASSPSVTPPVQNPTPPPAGSMQWSTSGEASVTDNGIRLSVAGRSYRDKQSRTQHAAWIKLEPQASYTLTFDVDLHTWDSYTGSDYWDIFSINVNNQPYTSLSVSNPVSAPFKFGGSSWDDEAVEKKKETITLTFPGNPNGDNYLNIALDTDSAKRAPNDPYYTTGGPPSVPDNGQRHPSWGTVKVGLVDIDIDSDNDASIGDNDGQIENDSSMPGKLVLVNRDDTDHDGVPDYADFDGIIGETLVPLTVTIPQGVDVAKARLALRYDDSSPLDVTHSDAGTYKEEWKPGEGLLRVWKIEEASSFRNTAKIGNGGDFWNDEEIYDASRLGFTSTERSRTFYIEGIAPSAVHGDGQLTLVLDVDGMGTEVFEDQLRVTSVKAQIISPGSDYSNAEITNLAAAWPNDSSANYSEMQLELKLTPSFDSLPGDWTWTAHTVGHGGLPFGTPFETARTISLFNNEAALGGARLVMPSLGFDQTVDVDFPDVGHRSEAANALLYTFAALIADVKADQAIAFATQMAATDPMLGSNNATLGANAIQHAYWNALMAYEFAFEFGSADSGETAASDFGTAHEHGGRYGTLGLSSTNLSLAYDSTMDLHNNEIGRMAGRLAYERAQAGLLLNANAEHFMQQRILAALSMGELWIIPTSGPKQLMVIKSNGESIFP